MTKGISPIGISVVVPVYKSAKTLEELHERVGRVAALAGWHCEIVYVNDASPDQSLEVLKRLPSQPAYKIVNLKSNQGQSTALLTGIWAATYPLVVTMDADLQDEPEQIPALFSALSPGKDVIFAARSGSYESGARLISSFLFKSLVVLASLGRIPAKAGLFMVARRKAFSPLFPYLPFSPYLIGLIARYRLHCQSLSVQRPPNQLGETSYTLRKRLRVAGRFFFTMYLASGSDEIQLKDWLSRNVEEL